MRAEITWDGELVHLLAIVGGAFSFQRSFADDNPSGSPSDVHVATITVVDKDGATSSTTAEIVVNNVAPVVTMGALADEQGNTLGAQVGFTLPGVVISTTGTMSDSGVEDTHTAAIAWGDGLGEPLDAQAMAAAHAYGQPGAYAVTLTVTDDDTGSGAATGQVRVLSPAEAVGEAHAALSAVLDGPGLSRGAAKAGQRCGGRPSSVVGRRKQAGTSAGLY